MSVISIPTPHAGQAFLKKHGGDYASGSRGLKIWIREFCFLGAMKFSHEPLVRETPVKSTLRSLVAAIPDQKIGLK